MGAWHGSPPPSPQPSARLRGILAITLGVLLLSLSDALVKLSGERFGLAQLMLLRSLAAAGLIAAGLRVLGRTGRPRRRGWVRARSLSLAAMWLCYYAALPSLSLALAAACYYTAPAWMALMARRRPDRRGWAAIGLTLLGAGLVANPQAGALEPAALLALAAAGFYALAGTITWRRCREESPGALALDLNLCLSLLAGLGLAGLELAGLELAGLELTPVADAGFALAGWRPLALEDWALAGLLGALLALVAVAVAAAYRLAPTPLIGVFDTSYLGFAMLWGVVFFAEIPGPHALLGIALIGLGALLATRGSRADAAQAG